MFVIGRWEDRRRGREIQRKKGGEREAGVGKNELTLIETSGD